MSRTPEDIKRMTGEDNAVGLSAHYHPLAKLINERNYKRGIEIGTAYGGSANHILSNCDLELLVCVDPYLFYPDMPGLFDQEDYDMVRKSAYERLKGFPAYLPLILDSKIAFEFIKNSEPYKKVRWSNPFDFVFIDGLHEYNTILWECEHYSKLLRPGGTLIGHDYDNFPDHVNKAVDEFAKKEGKELNLLPGHLWYFNY